VCVMAKRDQRSQGGDRRGVLTFTQYRGRNRKPHRLTLPILPALQRIIDASSCGDLTFLVNEFGRPSTDAGFGNKFRDWVRSSQLAAVFRARAAQGGRNIATNNGATARQLMAIFGWDTIKQAERTTRAKPIRSNSSKRRCTYSKRGRDREQVCPTFTGVDVPPLLSAWNDGQIFGNGAQGRGPRSKNHQ
jgi:hypothetical protein